MYLNSNTFDIIISILISNSHFKYFCLHQYLVELLLIEIQFLIINNNNKSELSNHTLSMFDIYIIDYSA